MNETIAQWFEDLNSDNIAKRDAAINNLSQQDSSLIPPLLEATQSEQISIEDAARIVTQADAAVLDALIKYLDTDNNRTRQVVIQILGKTGASHALEALVSITQDERAVWCSAALIALGTSQNPRILPFLLDATDADEPLPRSATAEALAYFPDQMRAQMALLDLSKDPDDTVRIQAVRSLARFESDTIKNALKEIGAQDKNLIVRQNAAAAIKYQKGDTDAFTALEEVMMSSARRVMDEVLADNELNDDDLGAIRHSNPLVRAEILNRLSETGMDNAVKIILQSLNDINPSVREAGVRSLVKMGEQAVEHLIPELTHKSRFVRASLIEALGKIGDKRALEPLIKHLKDPEVSVRLSIVDALSHFNDERSLRALQQASRDPNKEVRERARDILEQSGQASDTGLPGRFMRWLRGD